MGKVCRAKVAEHARLGADHARIGRAVELPVQALRFHIFNFQILRKSRTKASFSRLQLSVIEGSLARTPRWQISWDISHKTRF